MPDLARPGLGRTTVFALSMATVCMVAACAGTRNDTSTTTASAMPSEPSGVLGPSPTEASPAFTRIALPDLGGGLVVAGGTLWDATDSGAVQIDTTSGTVSEAIRGVTNLAFDGERLWAGGEKLLLELDPRSGEVLQRFAPDYNALYLAASPDAVWATDTFTGMVRRIDPSDGRVVATIEVPLVPKGTRLGEGALWIACDAAATVVRINTSTNEIEAQIAVGQGPHTIATGGGAVWVTNRHSSTLSKIDPTTNQVVATVKDVATSPNVGVDVGPKSVYVGYAGGLAMVDPDLAEITKRIDVGGISFYDLRVMDDVLWASNGSRPDVNGFYLQVLSD